MTHNPSMNQRRPAFTLVELLVAMALILFIMVILSGAFVAGLDSFRHLKSIGDMEERLRTAALILRRDLSADHFEGRRRLSDTNFWNLGTPLQGFVRIVQARDARGNGPMSTLEGNDVDGNPSYRATTHSLHFSVKLRGNRLEDFFKANVPNGSPLVPYIAFNPPTPNPNFVTSNFFNQQADGTYQDYPTRGSNTASYNSPWAEVAYYLVPNGSSAGNTPLYTLYRSQLVVTPDNRNLNWVNPSNRGKGVPLQAGQLSNYTELSCVPSNNILYFNSPTDLANGQRALDTTPIPSGPLRGATLLLSDVISFDVQVLQYNLNPPPNTPPLGADFTDLNPPQTISPPPWVFDTFVNTRAGQKPPPYTISAIQVSLRVWDFKMEQTRQVTIIQDM